jgi:hypothetical protein
MHCNTQRSYSWKTTNVHEASLHFNFSVVKKYTTLSQGYIIRITFLMFCGPCVVIYPCNKNQQDALFSLKFISAINLYMFRADLLLIIRW